MSTKLDETAERFKAHSKELVRDASLTGMIPSRSHLPVIYADLDAKRKTSVRIWLANEQHAAIARLDAKAARAWGVIRDRVSNYPRG